MGTGMPRQAAPFASMVNVALEGGRLVLGSAGACPRATPAVVNLRGAQFHLRHRPFTHLRLRTTRAGPFSAGFGGDRCRLDLGPQAASSVRCRSGIQ